MFLHIKMEVQCLLGQRVPFLKKEKRKRIFPIQCRCVKGQIEQVPYNINRLLFSFFDCLFRFALPCLFCPFFLRCSVVLLLLCRGSFAGVVGFFAVSLVLW